MSLKFTRVFTVEDERVADSVSWERRDSVITNPDGSVVAKIENVEVPSTWSQLATDIVAQKYFRKAGVNRDGQPGETSVAQVIDRIASAIAASGKKQGYFENSEDEDAFYCELAFILLHQYGAFNSPVWFNCGLSRSYGIKSAKSSGNYRWDPSTHTVIQTSDDYEYPQSSACFIQSVPDDLMGMYEVLKNEGRLFKFGSGTGSNFSRVRAAGEPLANGGVSSGLMSFLKMFDTAAGSIKSGGTTRRSAKMVCLDMDHPDIETFIQWKVVEEKKAKALIAAGYPSDFNGEAYATVSGQNSNNSVRISDAFMRAVLDDDEVELKARVTGEVVAKKKARDLWNLIAEAAWACADPGVQFDDTINAWHTCTASGRINASNPCAEFMYLDDTACNLASVNLTKFLRKDGSFDTGLFQHVCRILFIAQDILVDMSSYPTKQIAQNSHDFRPLGLGYANLGALLMLQGKPYDSKEGRKTAALITALMTGTAYKTSAEMAHKLGPFKGYKANRDSMLSVIGMHEASVYKIPHFVGYQAFEVAVQDVWRDAVQLGGIHGYRNAQATVLAPTGTIGLLMDCDTTGVEPDFSLVKYKKLAGGGYVKIVNQSVEESLRRRGYLESNIKDILAHIEKHDTIEGAPHLDDEHLPVFDCANRCGKNGKRFIAPQGHIDMMAAVQPFLSGAISKSVNVPNETTAQEIGDLYKDAWFKGVKAVAIYRDGCKSSQPLNTAKDETKAESTPATPANPSGPAASPTGESVPLRGEHRRRLPKKRFGFTQEAKVGGHKLFLRTGEFEDGKLGEIFIDMHKEGASFRSIVHCFAMAVSIGLQYGVPLQTFVNLFTFTRFEPQGPVQGHDNIKWSTSIVDYIFRVLGLEYLNRKDLVHVLPESPEKADELDPTSIASSVAVKPQDAPSRGSKTSHEEHLENMMGDAPLCDVCGHITVRNAACYKCLNCGNSMGCS